MSYDKTNRGVLFNAKDRKTSDKSPDYTGTINVTGQEYRLAAWIKQGKKGKFMSLSVTTPDEKYSKKEATADPDFDDDLPF